jgi:hypothetical protein
MVDMLRVFSIRLNITVSLVGTAEGSGCLVMLGQYGAGFQWKIHIFTSS